MDLRQLLLLPVILLMTTVTRAQVNTQTVRGTVVDSDTHEPLTRRHRDRCPAPTR